MADLFITPDTLAACLHRPDAPAILDMRDADDAAADRRRIPGAPSISLAELEAGADLTGAVVCSCQKGGKISQLGAAILRARGVPATTLRGGHLAWIAAGLPLCSAARPANGWAMPLDPDWSMLAALWVLRRLVDRTVPVLPVERDWLAPAAALRAVRALPNDPAEMARLAGLDHPLLPRLAGGPERLLAGRLARSPAPEDALDLIDDWLAGMAVAA